MSFDSWQRSLFLYLSARRTQKKRERDLEATSENRETSRKCSSKRDILETWVFGGPVCPPSAFCDFSVSI